jgi:hypothetical protein
MQSLTALTLGALALGTAAFAYDASTGQTPAMCSSHQASVYFERNSVEFNNFAMAVIDRVAQDARACGASQVVAQARTDSAHADAITRAFASKGLGVVLVGSPATAPQPSDFVADRAVGVRLTLNSDVS